MERSIVRTEKEIDEVLEKAMDGKYSGSRYPGMSYEEGIMAFADWLFGDDDEPPFDED
jgi:hypothetical protein